MLSDANPAHDDGNRANCARHRRQSPPTARTDKDEPPEKARGRDAIRAGDIRASGCKDVLFRVRAPG